MSVTFSDIAAMLAARPALALTPQPGCAKILQQLSEQHFMLPNEWRQILQNLADLQQKSWPQYSHPRVALYASHYQGGLDQTQTRLEKLALQQDVLTSLCAKINADLRVYELDLSASIPESGISGAEAAHALSYGLMAVEEHVDALIVGSLSHGHEPILQRFQAALTQDNETSPLVLLQQAGAGHDLFALLGAVLSARMAQIPVFGGAVLGQVLPLALSRLLPDETPVFLTLPTPFAAPDMIQSIYGLQQLQMLLALGPQVSAQKTVLPRAA